MTISFINSNDGNKSSDRRVHTFGDDQSLQLPFFCRSLHNPRLDRMGTNQPEYQDRFRLSYPVSAVLGLSVHLWVLKQKELIDPYKSNAL